MKPSNRHSFIRKHWKLGMHLVFKTRRFGVNNKGWECFDSLWGLPLYRVIMRALLLVPLIHSYRAMKNRMDVSIGFVPEEEFDLAFPEKKEKKLKNINTER